jgi:hypothetical protein
VSTLLLYYNALKAAVAGTTAAVIVSSLICFQGLLHSARSAGLVAIYAAVVVSFIVCTAWPNRSKVFMDKASIPQDDEEEKRKGILSIGYYLKKSEVFLVLWDKTYLTRLWCVFEFAAYLKLRTDGVGGKSTSLRVLPSFHTGLVAVGFTLLLGTFSVAFVMGAPVHNWMTMTASEVLSRTIMISGEFTACMLLLSRPCAKQHGSMDGQHEQLSCFSLDKAQCFCCDNNHVHPDSGAALDCDRELIRKSVEDWFEDVEVFDEFAREELEGHVKRGMTVPYTYVLFACLPWLWDSLGKSAWLFNSGSEKEAGVYLFDGVLSFLVYNPLIVAITLMVFKRLCKKDSCGCLQSITCTLMCGVACFLITGAWHITVYLLGLPGYAVLAVVMGLAVLSIFRKSLWA